jgi:biopolymer transport protein ExbB
MNWGASAGNTRGHCGASPWRGIIVGLAVLLALGFMWRTGGGPLATLLAQESDGAADSSTTEKAPKKAAKKAPSAPQGKSLLYWWLAGGTIGMIICVLSVIALGFVIEHAITIRKIRVMPPHVLADLEQMIEHNQIDDAITYCLQPQNQSLASDVILAGLERFRGSEFGFAEYKSAAEEAGEEHSARLYRKTEVLGVIGAIAPMLGLLGTVQGMIIAFDQIASSGGMAKPEELAGGIGLALVTTFEGLVVAIPAMVAFSYFRNKIDSLVAETGKRVDQVLTPLGRKR